MQTHTIYTAFIILTTFMAMFSYLNTRFFRLPSSMGILLISLIFSLLLLLMGNWFPKLSLEMTALINKVNFSDLLMHIMLGFLLFAGGLHVEMESFRKDIGPIVIFSTISVIISTVVVGSLLYLLSRSGLLNVPPVYCFIFGALISPTDPIAVGSILSKSGLPKGLQTKVAGESLLNDSVGIVLFIGLVELAESGTTGLNYFQIIWLFIREAGGGLAWGFITGYACFYLIKAIDDYKTEIFITIALVMGGYFLAEKLNISGALSMAVAGIIIGNHGRQRAMSKITEDYLLKFWELIDEILNAMLFLLIGLEMLVIPVHSHLIIVAPLCFIAVILARWVSIFVPAYFINRKRPLENHAIKILTWCGLRGGISIGLALSLSDNNDVGHLISITYAVVILSIVIQGSTIEYVLKRTTK